MMGVGQAMMVACLVAGAAMVNPASEGLVQPTKGEKISGYAEFKRGDTVMVDGQRVVATQATRISGTPSLRNIPLGYEVKVEGHRDPSGAFVAEQVQARPNGTDGTEEQIIAASNQAEETWVKKRMMFEPGDSGKIIKIGDILESGPYVDRARRIIDKLRPSYIPGNALRVRAVKTDQWNASAMANGRHLGVHRLDGRDERRGDGDRARP